MAIRLKVQEPQTVRIRPGETDTVRLGLSEQVIYQGTSDYDELENRPQINGVTLTGNKSDADLGVQSELTFDNAPTANSSNPVKSSGIYNALADKADTATVNAALAQKADTSAIPTKTSDLVNDGDGDTPFATQRDIPVVPTEVSVFYNDAGYTTTGDVQSEISTALEDYATSADVQTALDGKQNAPMLSDTSQVTFADMVNWVLVEERDVWLVHVDPTYGMIGFVGGWVVSFDSQLNPAAVGATASFTINGALLQGELSCDANGWTFHVAGLQPAGDYAAAKPGDATATALASASIPFTQVDSTSTATVFTATVPGITEYRDGVSFWLRNGVITSAAGFTVNINSLGAKKVFSNMAPTTQDTTLFNVNYTMLFVYCEWLDSGAGGFLCYRGYDANTNTIGYQLRTNSTQIESQARFYRYRLLFTSANGEKLVPANDSTSTNATSVRAVNQAPIDPHGQIYYYSGTAAVAANSYTTTSSLWQQYVVTLGYSFNTTGAALTLSQYKPVYIVCNPQTDGSAIIDSTTPYAQALPTTADGKIYIFLGIAASATTVEVQVNHPVYHYYNGAIRRWVGPV